jgi:hypothetical protein
MPPFGYFLKTAWYNVKIIFGLKLAASVGICILAITIFDLSYLTFDDISQIGELFLSVLGIILLPGLGNLEGKTYTGEIVYTKARSYLFIFWLRIILTAGAIFLLIFGVVLYARLNHGSFGLMTITCGVFISALYLGTIGFTVANLQREPAAGYTLAFGYFIFEYFTRGKYTSHIYVFSLLNKDFNSKYVILIVILILLVINYSYVKYKYTKGALLDFSR